MAFRLRNLRAAEVGQVGQLVMGPGAREQSASSHSCELIALQNLKYSHRLEARRWWLDLCDTVRYTRAANRPA